MLTHLAGVLFDGLAYGSLLFIISVGLSVTLGLMNFLNLAHGAFAMLGGYACVLLMNRAGLPFLVSIPLVFILTALAGALLESTLFRRLYRASHLDHVLFTIGLSFVAMAAAVFVFGPSQQPFKLPPYFQGQVQLLGVSVGAYRLFLIAVVALLSIALAWFVTRTRFGAMVRASVDSAQASSGLGINVSRVFSATFALGSGLAGLGGALGIPVLGLDPNFGLQFLVHILLVVTVGGAGSMTGTLFASLALGMIDTLGKYYASELGGFVIYGTMIILLLLFPHGLNKRGATRSAAHPTHAMVSAPSLRVLMARAQRLPALPTASWRLLEVVLWLSPLLVPLIFPGYLALATQIVITCIFVISLDLILGYAGVVSIGHAAPFGLGAYTAALLALNGWPEPISGLMVAAVVGGLFGLACSFLLRGSDITRLMVTLGICLMLFEAANRLVWLTGGADGLGGFMMGDVLGQFAFDLEGRTAFFYAYIVLIVIFWCARRIVDAPLGLSLRGIREGVARMPAIGAPVRERLRLIYAISCGIAALAGALLTQSTQSVATDSVSFLRSADLLTMLVIGGVGWLYGGLIGVVLFLVAQDILASLNPAYWHFWLGLLLMFIVLVSRGGIGGAIAAVLSRSRGRTS
jgi:branched-chain amino acid transport system permease protein